MHLANYYLWWLIFLPLGMAFYFNYLQQQETSNFAELGSEKTLRQLTNVSINKRRLKNILLLTALLFIVLAIFRPQWGLKNEKVENRGLDLIVALDNSASMYAEDIQPSRLEKSVMEISKLLKNLKGDRIGLITFSGSATPVCPLTSDYGAIELFLKTIKSYRDALPGTNIEAAFNTALNMYDFKMAQDKIFLLFTDGENHEGNLDKISSEAKAKGIIVIPVAVGTTGGQPVPVYDQNGNRTGYKKDKKGEIVISHININALKKIASIGPYIMDSSTSAVSSLLPDLKNFKRTKLRELRISIYAERYQIFLLIGLVFLLISYFINDYEDKVYKKSPHPLAPSPKERGGMGV